MLFDDKVMQVKTKTSKFVSGCCLFSLLATPFIAVGTAVAEGSVISADDLNRAVHTQLFLQHLVQGGNGNGGGNGGGNSGDNGHGGENGGYGAGDGTGDGDGPEDGTGWGPGTGDCLNLS